MIHNWLTIPDAAQLAGVTTRTIYRWINTGLQHRKTCGHTYIHLPSLVDYQLAHTQTNVIHSP